MAKGEAKGGEEEPKEEEERGIADGVVSISFVAISLFVEKNEFVVAGVVVDFSLLLLVIINFIL